MKAVIYTRVSSNEQVKGTSLEDQEKKCREYCGEKSFEVLKVFREEGESAKTADRTEFLRALEFCRKNKGKVDFFVVVKVDRFARNTEDHFSVRKILLDYGVTLHSVTEPIGNDPVQKLLETVLAGAAEFDNAIRSQRSVDGMIARVRQGITPWKPPLGYLSNKSKMKGEKKSEPDNIDPDLFPIIQRVLKRFARQEIAFADVGTHLDQAGFEQIRGRQTTKQMVDKILGQYLRFYAGIIDNPWVEGEEIEGLHKPMITKDEMYRIIAIREGKRFKKQPPKTFNPLFPLKKSILCGTCQRYLTASPSKGNGGVYGYYHCFNKECEMRNRTIAKLDVEKEFVQLLGTIQPTMKHLQLLKETVIDLWEEKRKRIFEMREDGSYSKQDFGERRAEIDNQIAAKRISMNESNIDELDVAAAITYATHFVEKLDRQWVDLKPELKLRFQKLIFPEGILYFKGQGFQTTRLSLILQLKETARDEQSLLVTPRGIEPRFAG